MLKDNKNMTRKTCSKIVWLSLIIPKQAIDEHGMCPYFGFDSIDEFYSGMSALGDIPYDGKKNNDAAIIIDDIGVSVDGVANQPFIENNNNNTSSSNRTSNSNMNFPVAKIQTIPVPLCVVHAMDDPIVSWKGTARNDGWMHPSNLVQNNNTNDADTEPTVMKTNIGSSYLMILLTKTGGHVGWPIGGFSFWKYKWKWMSDAIISFAHAIDQTKQK